MFTSTATSFTSLRRCLAAGSLALVLCAATSVARSGDLVEPDPSLSAREVIEIQLDALQLLDRENPEENMRQVWAMAHPANKAYVGTIARFGAMLNSPGYDTLVGHRGHAVLAARAGDEVTEFYVTVESADGATSAFLWMVAKVAAGEHAGCWMTIAVSPAVRINREV